MNNQANVDRFVGHTAAVLPNLPPEDHETLNISYVPSSIVCLFYIDAEFPNITQCPFATVSFEILLPRKSSGCVRNRLSLSERLLSQ